MIQWVTRLTPSTVKGLSATPSTFTLVAGDDSLIFFFDQSFRFLFNFREVIFEIGVAISLFWSSWKVDHLWKDSNPRPSHGNPTMLTCWPPLFAYHLWSERPLPVLIISIKGSGGCWQPLHRIYPRCHKCLYVLVSVDLDRRLTSGLSICDLKGQRFESQVRRSLWWQMATRDAPLLATPDLVRCCVVPTQGFKIRVVGALISMYWAETWLFQFTHDMHEACHDKNRWRDLFHSTFCPFHVHQRDLHRWTNLGHTHTHTGKRMHMLVYHQAWLLSMVFETTW